ncbi:MAG: hypothetical protein ACK41F_00575 [Fimbriimonadaceae bacterium]
MKKTLVAAALAAATAPSAWSAEIVLFDNLQNGYENWGWSIDFTQSVANPFSSTVDGTLSEVRVALSPLSTLLQPTFYQVSITDALGGLPGPNTLYQWDNVQGAGLNVLTFASDVPVVAGGSYFVKVAPANRAMQGGWRWNLAGDSGPFAFTFGGTWHPFSDVRGAMTVKATTDDGVPAVPGPAAAIPFALGLLARRRRR